MEGFKMEEIKDKIILELLQNDDNIKLYLDDLNDTRETPADKEQLLKRLSNAQSTIKDEAQKILIYTLLNPEFDNTKLYNNNELENYFYKFWSCFYMGLELITLDYFQTLYKKAFKQVND